MLDRHLQAKISPLVREENTVFFKNYRVSVLGEGLFRVERNAQKKFRDRATQTVWFRDMPAQEFCVEERGEGVAVRTKKATLVLFEDAYFIELDGKKIAPDNVENLLGTYRTLDCCDGNVLHKDWQLNSPVIGKVELELGVCARNGVAVYDDASSLSLSENGSILPEKGEGIDEYVFVYPNDYRGAVNALYMLTGSVPLLPRYALGNWWSRYYAYSDKQYLKVTDKFVEYDVPLTVATVDMDWHYSDEKEIDATFCVTERGFNTPEYGGINGWTGYTWNKRLFPDHKRFLRELHERGLKVTLNLHPADGIRWWEDCYSDFAKNMGVDPDECKQIKFDVTDAYLNNYFSIPIARLEEEGVDFWWIDWQQGETSSVEGLDPLWVNNHYHTLDSSYCHSRGLILSRYCKLGSHRYPLGFSGDTHITWETLRYLIYFTATASNVGYTWWSHDIGGHAHGETKGELYLRHVQYGVFSPINRLHSSNALAFSKEPWTYVNGVGEIAMKFLRFRHKMLPFLYTANYQTHTQGKALVEPLYYEYPETKQAYEYKEEYFFGGLLVAPVTETLNGDGYAPVKVWLPEGKWTDIFTGDEYEGGTEKTLLRTLDGISALAKAGTVLPLSADRGNSTANPTALEVHLFCGNGEYTLYEDNAEEEKDGCAFTQFTLSEESGVCRLAISSFGDEGVIPQNRTLKLVFRNIAEGEAKIICDGEEITAQTAYAEHFTLLLPFAFGKKYEVSLRYPEKDALTKLKERTEAVLLRSEGNNAHKERALQCLKDVNSIEEYRDVAKQCELSQSVKERLLETL